MRDFSQRKEVTEEKQLQESHDASAAHVTSFSRSHVRRWTNQAAQNRKSESNESSHIDVGHLTQKRSQVVPSVPSNHVDPE